MAVRPPSLMALADEFLAGSFTPNKSNPLEPYGEPPDVVLASFLLTLQDHGGDLNAWDEESWATVLARFGFLDDYRADALEEAATWGVVDNYEYTPQGLADSAELTEGER